MQEAITQVSKDRAKKYVKTEGGEDEYSDEDDSAVFESSMVTEEEDEDCDNT